MNQPDAASEQVAETESGEQAQNQLNPHLGHLDPDQRPDGNQESDQEEAKAGDESGESPAPVEDSDEKSPPRDEDSDEGLQKRFAELAFENRQLKRQLDQRAQSEPEAPEQAEPLKTLKDFDYDEQQFNAYLVDEGARRAEARLERKSAETTQHTEAQRKADEFASRVDAFEAEVPGFKERLHNDNLSISPEMADFIMDPTSEVGLHMGDYLSRNPTEAAKIAAMPETAQAREMVKLETRISKEVAKAAAEKSKASKAPEPPANTVDGTDPGVELDPSNPADADALSDEEWSARRNRQLEKRRNAR